MKVLATALGFGAIIFSVSAWHLGFGMGWWNLTHSIAYTLLPVLGTWIIVSSLRDD